MAAATIDDIKALTLGYLTGNDLLRYCPFQVLQKQLSVDDTSLQIGCDIAYSEVRSALSQRYNIDVELAKTTDRFPLLVKITSILAIKNITGNQAAMPEQMTENNKWVDDILLAIRNGQQSLIGMEIAATAKISNSSLIRSSFATIG
jgi:hypothetical protein